MCEQFNYLFNKLGAGRASYRHVGAQPPQEGDHVKAGVPDLRRGQCA